VNTRDDFFGFGQGNLNAIKFHIDSKGMMHRIPENPIKFLLAAYDQAQF
jgi:hypothetical protein